MSGARYVRILVRIVTIGAVIATATIAYGEPVVVTDVLGRTVTLPGPAFRLVLAEGRQIVALSLLDPEPVGKLVGWLGDMRRNDRGTYELYRHKFPGIDTVPVVGAGNDGTLSAEKIIALRPDVVVFGVAVAPGGADNTVVRQLGAAGIPVAFTDFFVDPFAHTLPSVRVLGQLIGHATRAEAFIAFYREHMDRIAARLRARAGPRPKILVEAHAGMAGCCYSPGRGNIGQYVEFAGGHSIGADVLPGPTGQLSLEYILAQNPEVYVATGGSHLEAAGGLVIGPRYGDDVIQSRLSKVAHRPGIADLRAVREGRVHGLFHNLMTTPLNILATELLAKWINPGLFADLDPSHTEAELNARFLAVPMQGTYWMDLK